MTFKKTLAASLVTATLVSAPLWAANHPVTGEKLAEDQTFTYWALDEHSSFDPQIVEDVSGSEHVRNLFEGLLAQDADGNLVPAGALRYEASADKKTYTFYCVKNLSGAMVTQ